SDKSQLPVPENIDSDLLPHHLEELRRSGLSDATIQASRCFSIQAENAGLLKAFAKGVTAPGLALPICPPGAVEPVGFIYKADNPRTLEKGGKVRTCKYEMPRGGLNRIHVPRAAQRLFNMPDGREAPMRILITEGWKKSEKAV